MNNEQIASIEVKIALNFIWGTLELKINFNSLILKWRSRNWIKSINMIYWEIFYTEKLLLCINLLAFSEIDEDKVENMLMEILCIWLTYPNIIIFHFIEFYFTKFSNKLTLVYGRHIQELWVFIEICFIYDQLGSVLFRSNFPIFISLKFIAMEFKERNN